MALCGSNLKSFAAPPSLRRIGGAAFSDCCRLKSLRLGDEVQELGWFCLWRTGVSRVRLPSGVRMTREQLGLYHKDPKALRLPDGLETVGDRWFAGSDVERVAVPSSVRALGEEAFADCRLQYEVIFEPGSRLERIGNQCFCRSGLAQIEIPRSVRDIGHMAFYGCREFCSLCFEAGSQLCHVGSQVCDGTQLVPELVDYSNKVGGPRVRRLVRDGRGGSVVRFVWSWASRLHCLGAANCLTLLVQLLKIM